jgi:hypothetical protein
MKTLVQMGLLVAGVLCSELITQGAPCLFYISACSRTDGVDPCRLYWRCNCAGQVHRIDVENPTLDDLYSLYANSNYCQFNGYSIVGYPQASLTSQKGGGFTIINAIARHYGATNYSYLSGPQSWKQVRGEPASYAWTCPSGSNTNAPTINQPTTSGSTNMFCLSAASPASADPDTAELNALIDAAINETIWEPLPPPEAAASLYGEATHPDGGFAGSLEDPNNPLRDRNVVLPDGRRMKLIDHVKMVTAEWFKQ